MIPHCNPLAFIHDDGDHMFLDAIAWVDGRRVFPMGPVKVTYKGRRAR